MIELSMKWVVVVRCPCLLIMVVSMRGGRLLVIVRSRVSLEGKGALVLGVVVVAAGALLVEE